MALPLSALRMSDGRESSSPPILAMQGVGGSRSVFFLRGGQAGQPSAAPGGCVGPEGCHTSLLLAGAGRGRVPARPPIPSRCPPPPRSHVAPRRGIEALPLPLPPPASALVRVRRGANFFPVPPRPPPRIPRRRAGESAPKLRRSARRGAGRRGGCSLRGSRSQPEPQRQRRRRQQAPRRAGGRGSGAERGAPAALPVARPGGPAPPHGRQGGAQRGGHHRGPDPAHHGLLWLLPRVLQPEK